MLPYLLAERAPLWDPDLRGAYLGVRREHTRAHFVRAAVEGVCLQLRVVLDALDRLEPVRVVRVTGGAFRSPLWREVMAAALDRPLPGGRRRGHRARRGRAGALRARPRAASADAVTALTDPAPRARRSSPRPSSSRRTPRARPVPELMGALGAVAGLFETEERDDAAHGQRDARAQAARRAMAVRARPGRRRAPGGLVGGPLPGELEMPVPASYNDLFPDTAIRDHVGDAWYQTTCACRAAGRVSGSCCDSTRRRTGAVVWVDGTRSPSHEGGYTPFEADVTES